MFLFTDPVTFYNFFTYLDHIERVYILNPVSYLYCTTGKFQPNPLNYFHSTMFASVESTINIIPYIMVKLDSDQFTSKVLVYV